MGKKKRFYWLKLQEDFFNSIRIKKLRKLAGGDTYTIIYLKMQLLSLAKGGVLEYTGLEENFASELALDLDEEPENVAVTINYLLSCGLMETSDSREYMLPFVIMNTGSENESAERVRKFREKQKVAEIPEMKEESLPDIEGSLHCNATETKCNREIDIDKEKEIEIDTDKESKETSAMYYPEDEALDNEFNEYIKFRKKIKKPMTDYAIKLAMTNLKKLSGGNNDKAIEILRASIVNGWQGLYPLREENNGKKSIDWDSI